MSEVSALQVDTDLLSVDSVFSRKNKPALSILRSIAEDFWHDSRDFLRRFDCMRDLSSARSARVKNFVDLRMACECALKSHALLSKNGAEAAVYGSVLNAGHKIKELSELCSYLSDRVLYDEVVKQLAGLTVQLRYSTEANYAFYAWKISEKSSAIDYDATLGSPVWLDKLRDIAEQLISSLRDEFTGHIVDSVECLFENDESMKNFMDEKSWRKP